MGLAFDADGVLWVTGGTLYERPGFIWRVERGGAVRQWCELPDATFMKAARCIRMGECFWPARVPPAISSRSILANLAAGKSGFRGIGLGRLCPDIRARTGSRSARAGRGSVSQVAG